METHKLRDYQVSPMDSLFFDANVWIHIFGTIGNVRQSLQQQYANLLRDAISREATIFITSSVISEYINVILRKGFKVWLEENHYYAKDFKRDYRHTDHYLSTLNEARLQVDSILGMKIIQRISDDFQSVKIDKLLDSMNADCDYNDAYYIWFCESKNLKMVSDDGDMSKIDSKVKLITPYA